MGRSRSAIAFQLLSCLVCMGVSGCLISCTTINRGITDYLFVDTVPQGASVSISEMTKGRATTCPATPCAIARPRGAEFIITIEREGYESVDFLVTSNGQRAALNGTVVGNTVVGGGLTVAGAAAAGAMAGELLTLGAGGSGLAGATASAAVPLAGGVVATMAVFDVSSGANQNLYPNPIVLALAPEGTEFSAPVDPRVSVFREQLALEAVADRICGPIEAQYKSEACILARGDVSTRRREIKAQTKALFAAAPAEPEPEAPD